MARGSWVGVVGVLGAALVMALDGDRELARQPRRARCDGGLGLILVVAASVALAGASAVACAVTLISRPPAARGVVPGRGRARGPAAAARPGARGPARGSAPSSRRAVPCSAAASRAGGSGPLSSVLASSSRRARSRRAASLDGSSGACVSSDRASEASASIWPVTTEPSARTESSATRQRRESSACCVDHEVARAPRRLQTTIPPTSAASSTRARAIQPHGVPSVDFGSAATAVVVGGDSAVGTRAGSVSMTVTVGVGTVTAGSVAVTAGLVAVTPVRVTTAPPSPPPQAPSRKPATAVTARPGPTSPIRTTRATTIPHEPQFTGSPAPSHHPDRVIRRASRTERPAAAGLPWSIVPAGVRTDSRPEPERRCAAPRPSG